MNVVMVHPVHGAKVAINEIEVEQDEKNGWTRYNPEEVSAPAEQPKRRRTRRVTESIEQPNEVLDPASDESEGA